VTLFPEMIRQALTHGVVGALRRGCLLAWKIRVRTPMMHHTVDDRLMAVVRAW
jgi:tRNA G37 N-methylase TrmD